MSATNHTTNYELPIFIGTDKPAWLVDWNGAMTAIDTAIHTAEGKADQAGTDIGGIESSISTINSTITSINNAVSQLRIDTNANTGSINTITSLIGNGEPTTTDKTIIGAINEINADVIPFDFEASTIQTTLNAHLSINTGIPYEINALVNSDSSAGKIYGSYTLAHDTTSIPADTALMTFTLDNLDIESAFDVKGYVIERRTTSGDTLTVPAYLHFNVGNTVELRCVLAIPDTVNGLLVQLPPCLLFLTNLGD